jgi:hypothetical protein
MPPSLDREPLPMEKPMEKPNMMMDPAPKKRVYKKKTPKY